MVLYCFYTGLKASAGTPEHSRTFANRNPNPLAPSGSSSAWGVCLHNPTGDKPRARFIESDWKQSHCVRRLIDSQNALVFWHRMNLQMSASNQGQKKEERRGRREKRTTTQTHTNTHTSKREERQGRRELNTQTHTQTHTMTHTHVKSRTKVSAPNQGHRGKNMPMRECTHACM